jgi:hypothetical protein
MSECRVERQPDRAQLLDNSSLRIRGVRARAFSNIALRALDDTSTTICARFEVAASL